MNSEFLVPRDVGRMKRVSETHQGAFWKKIEFGVVDSIFRTLTPIQKIWSAWKIIWTWKLWKFLVSITAQGHEDKIKRSAFNTPCNFNAKLRYHYICITSVILHSMLIEGESLVLNFYLKDIWILVKGWWFPWRERQWARMWWNRDCKKLS